MKQFTPEQIRKLKAAADIVENGDLAVIKKIIEFEDIIEESVTNLEEIKERAISAVEKIEKMEEIKQPLDGQPGRDGKDAVITDEQLIAIAAKVNVPVIEKVIERIEVIKEQPIVTNEIVKEIIKGDTIEETRDKLEALEGDERLDVKAVKGIKNYDDEIATLQNRTQLLVQIASTRTNSPSSSTGSGGHTIQDEGTPLTQRTNLNFVGAGVTVTDDSGNDATIVTISTSAGAGFQAVTSGNINGSNAVFTWAVAPNAIVVDGVSMRKVAADGTVNWTGTTTTTLTVAPNFDIYGVA
jgi:hypothetical protein